MGRKGVAFFPRLTPPPAPYFSHSLVGSFPSRVFKEMPVRQVKKDLGQHPAILILRLDNNPYIFTSEAWLKKLMHDVRKTFLAGNSQSTRGNKKVVFSERSVRRRGCSLARLPIVLRVVYAGK